jgi:hypothetical protein
MSNVKKKVIPVLTEAKRSIAESFKKYLTNVPGKQETKEVPKQTYWALNPRTVESAAVKVQNIQHGK